MITQKQKNPNLSIGKTNNNKYTQKNIIQTYVTTVFF